MKKINQGFALVETLVVSVFVLSTLLFLFLQFRNINRSYNDSFRYNTVKGMYALDTVKKFILDNGYDDVIEELNKANVSYVDITECPVIYLLKNDMCNNLFDELNIENIYVFKENKLFLKGDILEDSLINEGIRNFIIKTKFNNSNSKILLLARFTDETYAYLRIN